MERANRYQGRHLSMADKSAILNGIRAGKKQNQIAAEINFSEVTIHSFLVRNGLPTAHKPVSPKTKTEILRRLKRHESWRRIALNCHVAESVVRKIAAAHRIKNDHRVSPSLRDKILRDKSTGRVAARKYGFCKNTIWKVRRRGSV